MKIEINESVLAEFEYMVQLHQEYGAPNAMPDVKTLVGYILASVADGSRRPGSWERQMLNSMGLVAETEKHECYRGFYGSPDTQK